MDLVASLAFELAPRNNARAQQDCARSGGARSAGVTIKPTDQDIDDALVERIARGDERAFGEVVRRHAGKLKALALGFSGGAGEADDIVQETLWSLWRSAGRWQPGGAPLAAYLTRVAINRAIDLERRRRLRAFFGLEDAGDIGDADPQADRRLVARRELADVARDIRKLPTRQRAAILLAADGERGNGEIAVIMGLTVGAVEQLLVRARRTLRSQLAARDAQGET
jgi:RNA polymerase sigma-70 factor (ECF subfamily)